MSELKCAKCEEDKDLPPRFAMLVIGAALAGIVVWLWQKDVQVDAAAEHRTAIAELRAGAIASGYAEWVADPKTGSPVWRWKEPRAP